MIRGLLYKTLRETWLQILLFGSALFVVLALITRVVPQLEQGLNQFLVALPFIRNMISALLGGDFGSRIDVQTLRSIVWVHPTVLTVVWAQVIVFCTRLPAGEIDRGTIDILMSWPASRRKLFLCDSLVWLLSGVFLLACGVLGYALTAEPGVRTPMPSNWRIFIVVVNLYCVYFAVGGGAYLASAISDRRGRAMGVIFTLLLGSFLLNFLAQFWPPARGLEPLGVLSYYQPAPILETGEWPWRNMAVLIAAGAIAWAAACEVFARRSICTV